jgi:putative transposase
VNTHSLYAWIKKIGKGPAHAARVDEQQAETNLLCKELKRVAEERDILKRQNRALRQRVPVRYAFIRAHQEQFPLRTLCRMMSVHRSGYYAWSKQSKFPRQKEGERLAGHIKQAWLESGSIYGYRKIHDDLRESGETCGRNRVARIMKQAGIKAQIGYRKPRPQNGKIAVLADNHLNQNFEAKQPNQIWVTDISYIRTTRAGCSWPS